MSMLPAATDSATRLTDIGPDADEDLVVAGKPYQPMAAAVRTLLCRARGEMRRALAAEGLSR